MAATPEPAGVAAYAVPTAPTAVIVNAIATLEIVVLSPGVKLAPHIWSWVTQSLGGYRFNHMIFCVSAGRPEIAADYLSEANSEIA